ncbi:alpha-amylase [Guggenheimella bovis]
MENGVLIQTFEWFSYGNGGHLKFLKEELEHYKDIGISALWLPPQSKATSKDDPGYGIYDLYDLGEFDQKGTVATKYGTKEDYIDLVEKAHELGINCYADIVLNHKAGADEEELFQALEMNPDNRLEVIQDARDIKGWTKFTFPGRKDTYSNFQWNFNHFTGVDYDSLEGKTGIFKILGENKDWAEGVSGERGSYDYLMFADIDHDHPEVRADLFHFAKWFLDTTKVDGFRFDALKHISSQFILDLVTDIRSYKEDFYGLGEFWVNDHEENARYIETMNGSIDLFDVRLHDNFHKLSTHEENDLRKVFDGTLVQTNPEIAVTFVDNHDTQPSQALESFVDDWFKAQAYALILFRKDGYPCIFAGDYYGMSTLNEISSKKEMLENLLWIRKTYAYGEEVDYFESETLIGWVRMGTEEHPGRLAVVVSSGDMGTIRMFVGEDQAGKSYKDFTGNNTNEIVIDSEGYGDFEVGPSKVSAWGEGTF